MDTALITAFVLVVLLMIIWRLNNRQVKVGLHCIFLARENLPFLKEWLLYHKALGVDRFYLYDNTGSKKAGKAQHSAGGLKLGSQNKYGVNYLELVPGSDEEIDKHLHDICASLGDCVTLIKWKPKNKEGKQIHAQATGHKHCLRNFGHQVDWMGMIDLDEWLYLKEGDLKSYLSSLPEQISCVQLSQLKFGNRFRHLDKNVTAITESKTRMEHTAAKNIFRTTNTEDVEIHSWKGKGGIVLPDAEDFRFNHYNAGWGTTGKLSSDKWNEKTTNTMKDNIYARKVRKACRVDPHCKPGAFSPKK